MRVGSRAAATAAPARCAQASVLASRSSASSSLMSRANASSDTRTWRALTNIDFSPAGIRARWEAGYANTARALEAQAWLQECDPLEGVILHEPAPGAEPAAESEMGGAVTTESAPASLKMAAE